MGLVRFSLLNVARQSAIHYFITLVFLFSDVHTDMKPDSHQGAESATLKNVDSFYKSKGGVVLNGGYGNNDSTTTHSNEILDDRIFKIDNIKS